MLKKLTITAAAGALLALGAGAVQAERFVLRPGLHGGGAPAAQQDRRGDDRHQHHRHERRDHGWYGDRRGFHRRGHSHWRLYPGRHPDMLRHHYWNDSYGYFHAEPRRYHRSRYGFYFPGYGLIRYGHRHTRFCPDWHFGAFTAGLVTGTVIDD